MFTEPGMVGTILVHAKDLSKKYEMKLKNVMDNLVKQECGQSPSRRSIIIERIKQVVVRIRKQNTNLKVKPSGTKLQTGKYERE